MEEFNMKTAAERQIVALKNTMKMYHDTLKSTIEEMPKKKLADGTPMYSKEEYDETIKGIQKAQEETIEQYKFLGGDMEELARYIKSLDEEEIAKPKKRKPVMKIEDIMGKPEVKKSTVSDKLKKAQQNKEAKEAKEERKKLPVQVKEEITEEEAPKVDKEKAKVVDNLCFIPKKREYNPDEQFDMVPLPSKGQCYANKLSSIGVSYLTAQDENLMVSPNLYRQGILVDAILKRKVMNDIDINDLIDGDRDAIVLWLRATGYGNEYPVSVTDPETGKEFNTTVDLSDLNFKPFKLEGDENGWFDYTLPISQDKVKFKFLSHKEKAEQALIDKMENTLVMKGEILTMNQTITDFINLNGEITEEVENNLNQAKENIGKAIEGIDTTDVALYTESLTNRMEASIMSVNGNKDREYISKYVSNMPAKDSWSLRNYMTENEPGVDFHFEVQKPESLGGGSMPVFLSVNQFVFLNVSR